MRRHPVLNILRLQKPPNAQLGLLVNPHESNAGHAPVPAVPHARPASAKHVATYPACPGLNQSKRCQTWKSNSKGAHWQMAMSCCYAHLEEFALLQSLTQNIPPNKTTLIHNQPSCWTLFCGEGVDKTYIATHNQLRTYLGKTSNTCKYEVLHAGFQHLGKHGLEHRRWYDLEQKGNSRLRRYPYTKTLYNIHHLCLSDCPSLWGCLCARQWMHDANMMSCEKPTYSDNLHRYRSVLQYESRVDSVYVPTCLYIWMF